jgi:hypothetical protein
MRALVEGRTEQEFVSRVVAPHLRQFHNAELKTIIVETGRTRAGTVARGGSVKFANFRSQVENLLNEPDVMAVTMMLDFYRLPRSFPKGMARSNATPLQRVEAVEQAIETAVGDRRFKAYLALHEFEAMLYATPNDLARVTGMPGCAAAMVAELVRFATPEDINDGPTTAPSKRLERHIRGYDKVLHGPQALIDAGLAPIRLACPHFAAWLSYLENAA